MGKVTRWGLSGIVDGWRRPLPWPRQLLVIGPVGLGDTVLALPTLRHLQELSPSTEVTWLARAAFEAVVVAAKVQRFQSLESRAHLDLQGFDALLSLGDLGASLLGDMPLLAQVPVRIGSAAARTRPHWCNHLVHATRFGHPRHEALRYLRLLRPFGEAASVAPDGLPPETQLQAPQAHLPAGLPSSGHVVLHPFSMGHGREWPLAHWIDLAHRLLEQGQQVVVTGSEAEGQRLAAAWPVSQRPAGVFDTCGHLDVAQLCTLLGGAQAMAASGTGPLHLAAALGTATLGLFPPRKGVGVDRWAALGRAAVSVQTSRRCSRSANCDNHGCACMAALLPQHVALALRPDPHGFPNADAFAGHVVATPGRPRGKAGLASRVQETSS
jgi:ADP-heptose:LPS heptosyltransferase